MSNAIEDRLNEMGITLPDAAAPAANYVPFVKHGNTLYVSGQISNGPDGLIKGKLGDGMTAEDGARARGTVPCRCWRKSAPPVMATLRG